jgi:hypothetical protein
MIRVRFYVLRRSNLVDRWALIEDSKIIENTMRRIGKYQVDYAPSGLDLSMEAPLEKIGWVKQQSAGSIS